MDVGDGIPSAVDHAEVRRMRARRTGVGKLARPHDVRGPRTVDERPAPRCVLLGEQLVDRHLHERRVGHVRQAVGVCEALRLGHHVDGLRRVVPHRGEVEPVEQTQDLQRQHAVRRQRRRVDQVSVVLDRRRVVRHVRRLSGQVGLVDQPACRREGRRDVPRQAAGVELLDAALGDAPDAAREVLLHEHVARLVRPAVGPQERLRARGVVAQHLPVADQAREVAADDGGQREAVVGKFGGRGDELAKLARAEAFEDRPPRVDLARHGGAQGTGRGHLLVAEAHEVVPRRPQGRAPAAREAVHLPGRGLVEHREDLAAEPAHRRQRHRLGRRHRDRGIEGIAALAQHLRPDRARERRGRADEAALREHGAVRWAKRNCRGSFHVCSLRTCWAASYARGVVVLNRGLGARVLRR